MRLQRTVKASGLKNWAQRYSKQEVCRTMTSHEPSQRDVRFLETDVHLREPGSIFGRQAPATDQRLVAILYVYMHTTRVPR